MVRLYKLFKKKRDRYRGKNRKIKNHDYDATNRTRHDDDPERLSERIASVTEEQFPFSSIHGSANKQRPSLKNRFVANLMI